MGLFKKKSIFDVKNIAEFNQHYLTLKLFAFRVLTGQGKPIEAKAIPYDDNEWSQFCIQAVDALLCEDDSIYSASDNDVQQLYKLPGIATIIDAILVFKHAYLYRFLGDEWSQTREAKNVQKKCDKLQRDWVKAGNDPESLIPSLLGAKIFRGI